MKTAVFEYGKQPLSEWIQANRDCERMVLRGNVDFDHPNCNYYNLLYGYDSIAKNFHPIEFDITDIHLYDCYGNLDNEGAFDYLEDQRPSLIFKMLVNRKYDTRFVYNGRFVTTSDKKVIIHC